jgi:hypothetical protein
MSKDPSPVQWTLPRWAANLIRETMEMDSRSGAFDPNLRQELSRALGGIKEASIIECAWCHRLCAAETAHLHQELWRSDKLTRPCSGKLTHPVTA